MSGDAAGTAVVFTRAEGGAVVAPGAGGNSTPSPVDSARPSLASAWAELLRLPALFTVPGDALAGAAATALSPNSRTLLAIASSLCLYEAGMTLNDWADREEDAAERPHRPLPSGRVRPTAALTAACALTATGLTLAARAGRPALSVAVPLAATVWAYDLHLKHTPAGPAAMATARALDLLLGAAATSGRTREALPSAALLGTHTLAVTTVSRHETQGGSSVAPLAALATTALLAGLIARGTSPSDASSHREPPAPGPSDTPGTTGAHALENTPNTRGHATAGVHPPAQGHSCAGVHPPAHGHSHGEGHPPAQGHPTAQGHSPAALRSASDAGRRPRAALAALSSALGTAANLGRRPGPPLPTLPSALRQALAAAYAATAARPYFHATLNPSPPLTQRAVGGGIRATIPLQAALSARSGATATALLVVALAPLGRRFARKVSIT